MIRNRIRQYGILWKQYLIRYRFLIPLILFLSFVTGMAQRNDAQQEHRGLLVGVYFQDETGEALLQNLKQESGIFTFISYDQEEEMIRQVENGTLECGYTLPEGFFQRISEGKTGRQITLYYSPASSAQRLSFEVIFSDLFKMLSSQVLEDYLKELGWEDDKVVKERLFALNEEYQENGSTFHFEYETVEGEVSVKPAHLDTFRGLVALMIFLMSLLGFGNCLELDHVRKGMSGKHRRSFRTGSIHVAVAGSVLLGGVCLILGGIWKDSFREVAGLLKYFVVLEIYIRVLSLFIRKSSVIYGLLPALLLGSCLFSPVFIRLETYAPFVSWISRIFPVTYYLEFFLI